MELRHRCCAGLDVHSRNVVACLRQHDGRRVRHEILSFDTTTDGLLQLRDWLEKNGCTHAAMESTGVYWKPVWHILEGGPELILANAHEVRNVPGRKSDVRDSQWLADLLAHGLIRSSFVPPEPIREMRDLTRTRKQILREVGQHTQRIQKVLEDANIKLTQVVSNIMGKSGRDILGALVNGESDPHALANLARGRLKAKKPLLVKALHGRVTEHHRFLIGLHLRQIAALESTIDQVEQRLGSMLRPFREAVKRLMTIPGVSDVTAHVIVAEVGLDMTRFPEHGNLISWAGLCPRSDESAGRRKSTRVRKGDPWLKTVLVQAAWGAARSKNTYLQAQFLRLRARRGPKKAILAVAASILTAAYYILLRQTTYQELGADYFQRRDREKIAARLVRRLSNMGYDVSLNPAA